MLKLDRMTISGFKSFSDSTEVVFPEGVTAVVGPNGCGKSNIGDAINWVLGEQSPRMLRGSCMQDVIFNGSESRKALGMAEVTLQLTGLNGSPGGETREVVLTRRLYRDGESEYLVNGARSRLRDIQEILREARVGTQTYATIEQGRIEQILSSRPKERRLIIEDAAGIAGFKHKRRLAEIKLEATQANLLRVGDIVAEVRRQINSLKRQAAKARRYQRLRDGLRSKEQVRFGARVRALEAELARWRDEERNVQALEAAAAAALASLEAEVEAERTALDDAERAARCATDALHQLDLQVDREEARIRSLRERIAESEDGVARLDGEIESLAARRASLKEEARYQAESAEAECVELDQAVARLERKQVDLDEAQDGIVGQRERVETLRTRLFESMSEAVERRNRVRSLAEAIERCAERRRRLAAEQEEVRLERLRLESEETLTSAEIGQRRAEIERLREEHGEAERSHREKLQALSSQAEAAVVAREQAKSAASRLRTLEDVATRFAGVSDGVKILLTSGVAAGVRTRGVVADFVESTREAEGRAEAYLHGLLPAVVVEDDGDAARAADFLRSQGAGRTFLLSRSQPAGRPAVGTVSGDPSARAEAPPSDPRILGRLGDCLTLRSESNGFIAGRIGEALLVDSLESALMLHRNYPEWDFLATNGDAVYASGLVCVGGNGTSDHGLLAHGRRIQEARAHLAEAEARSAVFQEEIENARRETWQLGTEVADRKRRLEDAERPLVELEVRAARIGDEGARARRRAEVIAQEIVSAEEEAARVAEDATGAEGDVRESEDAHGAAERTLREETESLTQAENRLRALSEEASVLRAEVLVRRQKRSVAEREREQLSTAIGELDERISAARLEIEASLARRGESQRHLGESEAALVRHLAERERTAASASSAETDIEERRSALQQNESRLKAARADLDAAREQASGAALSRSAAETERRHLDDLCVQELGVPAAEAAAAAGGEVVETDPEALEHDIAELKARIEAMGPVNLTAIEEFSGLEERYRFLTTQQRDLEQSMESLRETIRRINRASRDRFAEAFEAIRASFQEVFRALFNGGRADLRLEEGEDLLDCGVEIVAQPPGKRLTHVQLMSGGEKAMAAIALLFAIFRYQPSPFCLLDEVDAALDDVNINRFTKMLRDYCGQTQFILITHNKRSMETADLLYGVTMEEPGVSKLVSLKLD